MLHAVHSWSSEGCLTCGRSCAGLQSRVLLLTLREECGIPCGDNVVVASTILQGEAYGQVAGCAAEQTCFSPCLAWWR